MKQWHSLGTNTLQQNGKEMTEHTLLKSDSIQTKHEKMLHKVVKFLNENELRWVAEQKVLKLKWIKEKLNMERKVT